MLHTQHKLHDVDAVPLKLLFRPITFALHNQGILPNALKAIRAIDAQLGRELEDTLRPADSAANVSIFKNTGEQLMQCGVHQPCLP